MYYWIILWIFISILAKQSYYYATKRKYSFRELFIDITFIISLIWIFFYFMFFYLDKMYSNSVPYNLKLFYTILLIAFPLIMALCYWLSIKKIIGFKSPYFAIETFIFIFLLPLLVSNIVQLIFW